MSERLRNDQLQWIVEFASKIPTPAGDFLRDIAADLLDARRERDQMQAERDIAQGRADDAEVKQLKDVRDAAEAFLDYKCNCDTLADQGCICSVCLLKERFAALASVENKKEALKTT
jgi:ATP-dependent Clp protease ATP-binding subunit ClpA